MQKYIFLAAILLIESFIVSSDDSKNLKAIIRDQQKIIEEQKLVIKDQQAMIGKQWNILFCLQAEVSRGLSIIHIQARGRKLLEDEISLLKEDDLPS